MKRFVRPGGEIHHSDDVERIIEICLSQGYIIDADTAQWAWEQYSDMSAANWLSLGIDDYHIFYAIENTCEVVDE